MVFWYPLNRYVMTAAVIGMGGSAISLGLFYNAQNRFIKKPYCVKAVKELEQNKLVAQLIGIPVKIGPLDVEDRSQKFEALRTDIRVPFQGSNKSGILHIEADREENEDDWNLKMLDIKLDDISDKILIVYRRKEREESNNVF